MSLDSNPEETEIKQHLYYPESQYASQNSFGRIGSLKESNSNGPLTSRIKIKTDSKIVKGKSDRFVVTK